MRPRVRHGIASRSAWYRGERWHILGDPVSGKFHRLSDGAYAFVGLLDGVRTVDEAWAAASDRAGDRAPTQGEAVAILGQLWSAGVLFIETTPDVRALLERASKGRRRELAGNALSVLFPRVPLIDPDRFLDRMTAVFGWVFSWWGFAGWTVLVGAGVSSFVGEWGRFMRHVDGVLAPASTAWAIGAYIVAKLIHEMGHGVACKVMAQREGAHARVPTLGVMVLLGMPSPYVDATSAWGLSSKWRRIVVGGAGMYVELALASIAAIVWARVGAGPLSEWAFSTILVAGISTVVFNANPLLRYDGYYILSDLLEIPNLVKRPNDQLWHLASKWVWGNPRTISPVRDASEGVSLTLYALASGAYRLMLGWAITSFVWTRVPVVGTLVGIIAFITLLAVPIGSLIVRIGIADELAHVRTRAVGTTVGAILGALAVIGFVPLPHTITATGIVESSARTEVHAIGPGFIDEVLPSGVTVRASDSIVVRTSNPEVRADRAAWEAAVRRAELERTRALTGDLNAARAWESRADAVRSQLDEAARLDDGLAVRAPIDGVWLGDDRSRTLGSYVRTGDLLGTVESAAGTRIRLPVRESVAAAILGAGTESPIPVRIRSASGRGGVSKGTLDRVVRAEPGAETAPSRAFDAIATIEGDSVRVGERVVARVVLPPSPMVPRWIASIRRTLMTRDLPGLDPG